MSRKWKKNKRIFIICHEFFILMEFLQENLSFCSNGICYFLGMYIIVPIWIISYLWLRILSFQSHQKTTTTKSFSIRCEKLFHRMNNLLPSKRCARRQNWLYSMRNMQHRLEHSICHFHAVIYSQIPQQISCLMQHRKWIEMLCDCAGEILYVGDYSIL